MPSGANFPRSIQHRVFPDNRFNLCIAAEFAKWRAIERKGGLLAQCPGRRWKEPPWVKMPEQGKRFSKPGSVALPPPNGNDTLILQWRVPLGYDGCIASVVFNTDNVTGFVQGSGDLTWRLALNRRFVRDYGNVQFYIGSLQTPYNINSGQIILQSNQLVQIYVNRSVASAGNIDGGRVIGATFGWFWPR